MMETGVTTLKNGLRVVSRTMPSVETVSLGVWVDVGTRNEPAEINGVAHLLEHMAFKGTERRSALQIAQEIEDVGGHINAYTSREHTAYYVKMLKQDAGLGVDILSDILQNSVFDPDELERERGVILQEIGQSQDTPDDVIFDHFHEVAYPGQALGRSGLGTAEIIRRIPRDTIAHYMADGYAAPRMILSAAGAIEHEELVSLAERHFDRLGLEARSRSEPARYEGGEYREEKDLEQVHFVLGFPGISFADPDYYAASVLSALLGGGMSSRLFQEIREKRGLVYTVYSFASALTDGGLFGVYAGTGEDEVEELVPVLCDQLLDVTRAVGEAEVRRARAQLKASILMGLESTSTQCEQLANQMLIFGRTIPAAEIVQRVDEVDEAAVRRVAERILGGSPTLATLGPVGRIEAFEKIAERLRA